jgi:hypothetical protein
MSRAAHLFAALNLAAGASVALVAASPLAGPALRLFVLVQPGQDLALADQPITRWVLGIAGGVWAGWGAGMVSAQRGADPATALRAGLLVWCALDSLASAANGAWGNVAVNLAWLAFGWVVTRPAGG